MNAPGAVRMRLLLSVAGLCLLGGCVGNLLGGGKPDALYRFGASMPVASDASPSAPIHQTVALLQVEFAPEVDGDRLLAVHGQSARYIKGMRWVTAAPGLFALAMERRFQTRAPDMRLTQKRGEEAAGYALDVRVSRFEADYDDAPMAGLPTVVIEGDATISRPSAHQSIATRHFSARVVANQNRAGDVAAAFDSATTLITSQITDWVAATPSG